MSVDDLYVITDQRGNKKIGRSANVPQRLTQLQGANPETLAVWIHVPGGGWLEPVLHRVFATASLEGEWYPIVSHAADFIECLLHITNDGEDVWPSDVLRALAFIVERMERDIPCQQGKHEVPPIGEQFDAQFVVQHEAEVLV